MACKNDYVHNYRLVVSFLDGINNWEGVIRTPVCAVKHKLASFHHQGQAVRCLSQGEAA